MPPKSRIRERPSVLHANKPVVRVRKGKTLFLASRFHILINTNHAFKSNERLQACIQALREATNNMPPPTYEIRNWNMLKFFEWTSFGRKASQPIEENTLLYDTAILKYRMVYVFEKGPLNDYLHEHIDIQINHNSCIQFNHKQVYAYFKDALKMFPEAQKHLFIRIKRVKADMTNAYFKKNMMIAEGFDLSDQAKRAVHTFMETYPSMELLSGDVTEIPNVYMVR